MNRNHDNRAFEPGRRVLENVPSLAWGRGKDCTFAGALEAALAVTPYPYDYTEIMGFSALAFRTRWFKPSDGQPRWCPSCAVGEMEEAIKTVSQATGWPLWCQLHLGELDLEKYAPQIRASIDSGRPMLGYGDNLDMAVIHGYADGGRIVYLRDYHKGNEPCQLRVSNLGFLWIYLGEHHQPPSRLDALTNALKQAVFNWRRGAGRDGPGEYWCGDAAFEAWIHDLKQAPVFPVEEQTKLKFVTWWNFHALSDSRAAGVTFLRENEGVLGGALREAVSRARDSFSRELEFLAQSVAGRDCFVSPWDGGTLEAWTEAIRERECEILSRVSALEEEAFSTLEPALAS